VQVDATKPKLTPPGTMRLKLKCDILLSTSTFKFKLRRYTSSLINLLTHRDPPPPPEAFAQGGAVQIVSMKPMMKLPGS